MRIDHGVEICRMLAPDISERMQLTHVTIDPPRDAAGLLRQ